MTRRNATDADESNVFNTWSLALRLLSIMIPVILALGGVAWAMNISSINDVDERVDRLEERQYRAIEKIEQSIEGLRMDIHRMHRECGRSDNSG